MRRHQDHIRKRTGMTDSSDGDFVTEAIGLGESVRSTSGCGY